MWQWPIPRCADKCVRKTLTKGLTFVEATAGPSIVRPSSARRPDGVTQLRLSDQGSIGKVPRNWVESYVPPLEAPRGEVIGLPPVVTKCHLPDKLNLREISSDDVHASPSDASGGEETVDPRDATTVVPPLVDVDAKDTDAMAA